MSEPIATGVARTLITYEHPTTKTWEACEIRVQAEFFRRLPCVTVVGLAAADAKEAAERVRSAFEASGIEFPRLRVVVTIWDAPERTRVGIVDLAIAVAILRAMEVMPTVDQHVDDLYIGELALDGRVRPVRGTFAKATLCSWRLPSDRRLVVAKSDPEAQLTAEVWRGVCVADTLREVIDADVLTGPPRLPEEPNLTTALAESAENRLPDFSELTDSRNPGGQSMLDTAKQLACAVAQGHGILFTDCKPGCGATSVARRIADLLDPDFGRDARWVNASLCGLPLSGGVNFRAPHHTVSLSGMVGTNRAPGELALAEWGVLLLDEVEQFHGHVLEGAALWMTRARGGGRPVFCVAKTELSAEQIRRKLPLAFFSHFPVVISPPHGSFRGVWPSSAEIREMISEIRGAR